MSFFDQFFLVSQYYIKIECLILSNFAGYATLYLLPLKWSQLRIDKRFSPTQTQINIKWIFLASWLTLIYSDNSSEYPLMWPYLWTVIYSQLRHILSLRGDDGLHTLLYWYCFRDLIELVFHHDSWWKDVRVKVRAFQFHLFCKSLIG